MLKPEKGNRKVSVNLWTQLFLLIGLALAGWMSIDFQLYLCYAAGITGANIGFMWGNSKSKENIPLNTTNITTTTNPPN